MLETLIVIGVVAFFGVPTYVHHAKTSSATGAFQESCITAGLVGAIFVFVGALAVLDSPHQSWNNWLTSSLVVVVIASALHYGVKKGSGRHAA